MTGKPVSVYLTDELLRDLHQYFPKNSDGKGVVWALKHAIAYKKRAEAIEAQKSLETTNMEM
jgi:hypothetical protein